MRRGMTYKRLFGVFLIIGVVSVLPLLSPIAAHAAPPGADAAFNITTSPLPIQLVTTPSNPVSTDLRVQNSGTQPAAIKVSLLKFKSSDKTGKPLLIKPTKADSYIDWVSFSKTNFVAQPGEWNTIKMTISPPADAAFGYYYAVLFSQDTSNIKPGEKSSKLAGATATLVLLDVKVPGEKRKLEVTSFKTDHKLYEYLPVNFNIAVKNTGNVHLVPAGDIFISRGHNSKNLAVLSFNPNAGNVLPNSTRDFTVAWEDGFPAFKIKRDANDQIVSDKTGKPIEELKYDLSKTGEFRIGHYYAHLLLTYSDGDKDIPIEAEVGFWVIPWKVIGVVLLFVILVLLGLRSVFKSVKVPKFGKKNGKPQPKKPSKKS